MVSGCAKFDTSAHVWEQKSWCDVPVVVNETPCSLKVLKMCGCVKFCTFAHLQGLINECDVPTVATQSPCCVKKCKCAKICTFAHLQLQNKACGCDRYSLLTNSFQNVLMWEILHIYTFAD